jgi:hypothetical protein
VKNKQKTNNNNKKEQLVKRTVVVEEEEEAAFGSKDSSQKKTNRSGKSQGSKALTSADSKNTKKRKRNNRNDKQDEIGVEEETSRPIRRRRSTQKVLGIQPEIVARSEAEEDQQQQMRNRGNNNNNHSSSGEEEDDGVPLQASARANSGNDRSRTISSSTGCYNMESSSNSRASTPVWNNNHHHPPKNHDPNTIPLLSQYLNESSSSSSSCLYNRSGSRPTDDATEPMPEPMLPTPYGLSIPDEPPRNVCCGCLGARDKNLHPEDDEEEEEPVLLCEGTHCHREYHLGCCIPSLAAVPEDSWFCQDCSSEGSIQLLRDYLDAADAAKAKFVQEQHEQEEDNTQDYVQYLLRKDSEEANISDLNRFPESELERGGMTHALALCDPSKLARTRRGNEMREPLSASDCVGKPIRMYNPIANQYHTGRIVDVRIPSCLGASTSSSSFWNVEFLVRFTAGKDDRKVHYHHWIVLEEHCIAIGSTLVWARLKGGTWTPGLVWLRTSRELITVQQLLKESEGEIFYEYCQKPQQHHQQQQQQGLLISRDGSFPTKKKHKVFALVRSFGIPEKYDLVNVRDQCTSLKSTTKPIHDILVNDKNPNVLLAYQLALVEEQEQDRVRTWQSMTPTHPMHPSVFSSSDWYGLSRLELPIDSMPHREQKARTDSSILGPSNYLCPNVIRGLDRSYIVKQLQRRGFIPTATSKDVATSLHCEVMPVNAKTLLHRPVSRREKHKQDR